MISAMVCEKILAKSIDLLYKLFILMYHQKYFNYIQLSILEKMI